MGPRSPRRSFVRFGFPGLVAALRTHLQVEVACTRWHPGCGRPPAGPTGRTCTGGDAPTGDSRGRHRRCARPRIRARACRMFHLVEIVRRLVPAHIERRRYFLTAAASVRLTRDRVPARSPTRPANAAASRLRATQSAAQLDWTPARRARARRAMRPLEESSPAGVRVLQVRGENPKNIVDRADQPHCLVAQRYAARPTSISSCAFRAKPPNGSVEETHTTRERGDWPREVQEERERFPRARRRFPGPLAPSPQPSPIRSRESQTA